MLRKKKNLATCIALICAIVLSGYSINFSVFANSNSKSIFFLSDKESSNKKVDSTELSVVKSSGINNLNLQQNQKVWIDGDLMNNAKAKNSIKKLYDTGCTLVFKKEGILDKDVTDYLGIDMTGMLALRDSDIKGDDKSNVVLKPMGVLVSNTPDGLTVTQINVEEYNKDDEVNSALLFTTQSDFADRIRGKKLQSYSLLTPNIANALTTEWAPVNVYSVADNYARVTVQSTISLQKNGGNPDSAKNYYSLHKAVVVATPKTNYALDDCLIYQSANSDGMVYDYSPKDTSNTQSFYVSLPYGVGYYFNSSTSASCKLDSGGNGYNYEQTDFYPVNVFNLRTPTGSRIDCEPAIEMYQNSSNAHIYNWFQALMKYNVQTWSYAGAGNYNSPIRYYITRGIAGY